jgi:hypothetical protein
MSNHDDKYVTFKREDFERHIFGQAAARYADYELTDAVVIRRQDLFASPALATYAACIAITAQTMPVGPTKDALLDVGDYFERQSQLAADEGFKLPDV